MADTSIDEASAKHVIASKGKEYLEAYFGFPLRDEVCLQLAVFVYAGLIEAGFALERGKDG